MSRVTLQSNSPPFGTGKARADIKDVARLAKVSPGTVSNVLNHPDRVSPARQEAVERAIAQLGYVRHESARHLRAGSSTTLGLLLLDAWNPSFIDVARGVEDTTSQRGFAVLISNSARDSQREQAYLRLFAEGRAAGLIVVPHDQFGEDLHRIRARGVPVVVVDRAETGDGMSVSVDDVKGGELVGHHLIDLNHRHIAFVGDESSAVPVHDRLVGVRSAIAESESDIRLDVLAADLSVDAGRAVGEDLAAMPKSLRPTAVIAAIDLLAFGVMQALLQHGIKVPEEVSLVGYDDIPFSRQLSVPLTTVSRPHYKMGVTATEMLISALTGELVDARHVVFQPELKIRMSTGRAGVPTSDRARR